MLALRLLVTATLTAWAVTTYTPEIKNKLPEKQQWKTDKAHLQILYSSMLHYSEIVQNFGSLTSSFHSSTESMVTFKTS